MKLAILVAASIAAFYLGSRIAANSTTSYSTGSTISKRRRGVRFL